jgi:O-acetyl-ADP-ribose deacetylase (regulator of RNase III)
MALPALGAGLGGLDWATVRTEIEAALSKLDVDIHVYEPSATVGN